MTIEEVNWSEIERYYAKDCCKLGGNRLCRQCAGCRDMEKTGMNLSNSADGSYQRWLTLHARTTGWRINSLVNC
jgi:hypothetical protein